MNPDRATRMLTKLSVWWFWSLPA